jgi:hypothetical protein
MEYATAVQCWDRAVSKNAPRVETKTRTVNAVMRELGMFSARRCEPVPNALGMPLRGVITLDLSRFVAAPRRADKRTLCMSKRHEGPQYQGLDGNGQVVWGDCIPFIGPLPLKYADKPVKAAKVKAFTPATEKKVKKSKKAKPELAPLVWNKAENVMIRPGVFKRVKQEEE